MLELNVCPHGIKWWDHCDQCSMEKAEYLAPQTFEDRVMERFAYLESMLMDIQNRLEDMQ